jgi:hypothetical protein
MHPVPHSQSISTFWTIHYTWQYCWVSWISHLQRVIYPWSCIQLGFCLKHSNWKLDKVHLFLIFICICLFLCTVMVLYVSKYRTGSSLFCTSNQWYCYYGIEDQGRIPIFEFSGSTNLIVNMIHFVAYCSCFILIFNAIVYICLSCLVIASCRHTNNTN